MSVIAALWARNLKIWVRNRSALIFTLAFPFFFVFVFANIFATDFIENPMPFMMSGIIITTVFESGLRIASNTIDDMTGGFMKEVLVSPTSRLNIALGQFASSATIGTLQGILIYILGFFMGLRITSPLTVVYSLLFMVFVSLVFAGFGLFLGTKAKNMQTFQALSMAITMPMTFLSGAYIPVASLPVALQWVAYFNPMTYGVAVFRAITLEQIDAPLEQMLQLGMAYEFWGLTITPIVSIGILVVFGFIFLALSTWSFSKVDFSKMNRNWADAADMFG